MAVINLVQGDTGPQIKATLTRSDTGSAIDISGATTKMHFRKANTSTNLFLFDEFGRKLRQSEWYLHFPVHRKRSRSDRRRL